TGPAPLSWLTDGVLVGALVPLAVLLYRAAKGTLGADPVEIALNQLGLLALVLLVASLACTPVKILFGVTWPIRIRKRLRLLRFLYASLHLLSYVGIDQLGHPLAIVRDVVERPFILVGVLAFSLLVPLAATSTPRMLKRLGAARWKRLHRLAYVAAS